MLNASNIFKVKEEYIDEYRRKENLYYNYLIQEREDNMFNKNTILASMAIIFVMHPNPSPNWVNDKICHNVIKDCETKAEIPIKYKTRYVNVSTLNVRASASSASEKIGIMNFNAKIKVIKSVKSGKWLQISYKGKIRYVYKKYTSKKKKEYIEYSSTSKNSFKSYESGSCITNNTNIAQGSLKRKWKLDKKTGIYMVGDRYCVAVGSYYTNKIGTKLDLILKTNGETHVLKCILADGKADKDTVNNHSVHKDGSVAEFVVNMSYLPRKAKQMGDVSYVSKKFSGSASKIRVYK